MYHLYNVRQKRFFLRRACDVWCEAPLGAHHTTYLYTCDKMYRTWTTKVYFFVFLWFGGVSETTQLIGYVYFLKNNWDSKKEKKKRNKKYFTTASIHQTDLSCILHRSRCKLSIGFTPLTTKETNERMRMTAWTNKLFSYSKSPVYVREESTF